MKIQYCTDLKLLKQCEQSAKAHIMRIIRGESDVGDLGELNLYLLQIKTRIEQLEDKTGYDIKCDRK